ncbi:DJC27 protein, partial [Mionectes macconnelli]|nr:DJC27 protein [Mionectes macconnelli]
QSCIIKRYCEKRFVSKYLATIGIDYGVTKVQIRDREIKVNIFDMAGHPFFYEVRPPIPAPRHSRNPPGPGNPGIPFLPFSFAAASWERGMGWVGKEMKPHPVDSGKHRSVDESEGRLWAESRGFLYFETSAQTGEGISEMFQTFYSALLDLCEGGGKRPPCGAGLAFTREQADAIRRIRGSKDSWDMLGLKPGATREEVNKAYRRLAVLLHPDKCVAPGSEDAFKAVGNARTALLRNLK